jgi:hypothetical protein
MHAEYNVSCCRQTHTLRKTNGNFSGEKLMIAYRAQYEPFNLKAIEMAQGK